MVRNQVLFECHSHTYTSTFAEDKNPYPVIFCQVVPTRWLGMQGHGGNVSSEQFSALTSSLAAPAALLVFWQSRAHPSDYFARSALSNSISAEMLHY